VAGRYRGQAAAWDVVNEAVTDQADGLRGGLWMEALGAGYIDTAFHLAREADPAAPLFLNDYGLERADKRRVFLSLAEDLLRRGAPLGGWARRRTCTRASPLARSGARSATSPASGCRSTSRNST
jgi:endo-1,4-beta-xylanase